MIIKFNPASLNYELKNGNEILYVGEKESCKFSYIDKILPLVKDTINSYQTELTEVIENGKIDLSVSKQTGTIEALYFANQEGRIEYQLPSSKLAPFEEAYANNIEPTEKFRVLFAFETVDQRYATEYFENYENAEDVLASINEKFKKREEISYNFIESNLEPIEMVVLKNTAKASLNAKTFTSNDFLNQISIDLKHQNRNVDYSLMIDNRNMVIAHWTKQLPKGKEKRGVSALDYDEKERVCFLANEDLIIVPDDILINRFDKHEIEVVPLLSSAQERINEEKQKVFDELATLVSAADEKVVAQEAAGLNDDGSEIQEQSAGMKIN